ncbi:glycoside hydrolase family 130 protein [uncultured Gelidibacter sp.]|uniref:glycoside hydrolase family 130 protein n=1 Tax=uncultured Gelidibacter sp. TaxID=259318 RepID=UPI00262172D6|nr:glycoside hydrolase family 130 protein [uncultured Gelidibacter sp.]
MEVKVQRKSLKFIPDSKRVVTRFFNNGDERTKQLIGRILDFSDEKVANELSKTLEEFKGRHRNLKKTFKVHCGHFEGLINAMGVSYDNLTANQKMLIGSYSTMEYSIESAALFNPSIIEDFNQSFLKEGEKRVIISFRATGEGHLSSIVFRRAILDKNNNLQVLKAKNHIDLPEIGFKVSYDKQRFVNKMQELKIPEVYISEIMDPLPDHFGYFELKHAVNKLLEDDAIDDTKKMALQEMTWLVDSYYDLKFHEESDITERVIFPNSIAESRGIEDARFVRFTDDNGEETIYATYTAYNGHTIIPKLLSTHDFLNFRIMPIHGNAAQNKNFALFPRKINGKYAMLARIDGYNNYVMFSDRITLWSDPIKIQEPKFAWDLTQIGNCGSPIYTDDGWLILTHGVGPMRRYSIGASLLDLEDPTKVIGRLKEPLLSPSKEEREGYVPNVVYSCGGMIHNDSLIIPYAVSDYASSYATVQLSTLLKALKQSLD